MSLQQAPFPRTYLNIARHQTLLMWLSLLAAALVMNIFCTVPSPILCGTFQVDQSTFYTIGRSLASGLIPYVEFADVKGPLLPLIFSLGYVVSPEKPWGMTLLFSVSTFFVLVCSYKTACKLHCTNNQAFLASLLCLFFLFEPYTQDWGGRTEDFMKPAYALLLYGFVCYALEWHSANGSRQRALFKLGWIIGCGFTWNLLLKYNNAIPFVFVGGMVAVAELFRARSVGSSGGYILRAISGCLLVALPVVVYLYLVGALSWCWHVYVDFNIQTYQRMGIFSDPVVAGIKIASWLLQSFAMLPLITICLITIGRRYFPGDKPDGCLRLMLVALVGVSYAVNITGGFIYYESACSPLCIVAIVPVARILPSTLSPKTNFLSVALLTFAAILLNGSWLQAAPYRLTQKLPREVQEAEDLIATVPNARIMYRCLDLGLGGKASALPACRYWTILNGAPKELYDDQVAAIRAQKADFCIVTEQESEEFLKCLQESGYSLVYQFQYDSVPSRHLSCLKYTAGYAIWQRLAPKK